MNHTLKLSMFVALAFGSTQALALQLGQVQVKSALGQPLLAEIPLTASSADELQDLSVRLASSDAFTRAGITGARTTLPLQFSVVGGASGQKVIKITSASAVDNPYLDLLLEVNSHAGKSMREVAILLDPVSMKPIDTPEKSIANTPRTQPVGTVANSATRPRPVVALDTPVVRKSQYGPVHNGQTLSSIARDTALPGVDLAQMLLAYKRVNPDAFANNNINALKSGVILRVPTAAQAKSTALASAYAEVRRENSDWRGGRASKPVTVADAGTSGKTLSSPKSGSNDLNDRLALVPAKDGQGAGSAGTVKSTTNESAGKLRQDLLRSQESAANLQQQGDDLNARLKALTDINTNNTQMLSLKDSQIAQLQAQLALARNAAHLPSQPATAVPSAASQQSPALADNAAGGAIPGKVVMATAGSSAPAPGVATSLATAATAPKAATAVGPATLPVPMKAPIKARPVIHAPQSAAVGEEPWYMQMWAWAAAGGVAVVLLLLALIDRRRRASAAAPSRTSLDAHRFDAGLVSFAPAVDGEDVDQNELLDQLAEHPEDVGLHLELVALYYSRRDVEHFEAAAEAMYAHITDPQQDEWQDVLHMGEDLVPGHPLFDHHEELPAENEHSANGRFDIDDYAGLDEAPLAPLSEPESLPPLAPLSEDGFSFNKDPHSDESPRATVPEGTPLSEAASHPSLEPLSEDSFSFNLDPDTDDFPKDIAPEITPRSEAASNLWLQPMNEDNFSFDLSHDHDSTETIESAIAATNEAESRPWLEPLSEDSFSFNLSSVTHDSQKIAESGKAHSNEAVSVHSSASAPESFLIAPEHGIADMDWNLEGFEPESSANLPAAVQDEPKQVGHALDGFSDDPVDTKLDLARAYLDMGDAEGAQAMLGEVMLEGTQMQRDTAKALLEKID